MNQTLKILFFGDIIGKPGRRALIAYLKNHCPDADLIIANAENAAHGFGIQEQHITELSQAGVMVFSGGNHTFDRREIFDFIDDYPNLLRPANFPEGTPGRGHLVFDLADCKVGIINLQGRVFMEPLRSPFIVADEIIKELHKETKLIIVDIHAEATAEKMAMGWYLDGRVSAVIGTHTHVQTADERILPKGTAYLTDAGACGPVKGVIGMQLDGVFRRMVKQLPSRFEIADGQAAVCGVQLVVEKTSGKTLEISRIRFEEKAG
jgi:2',3'-cyclic-nucleotide 2'-phosphodiesterase